MWEKIAAKLKELPGGLGENEAFEKTVFAILCILLVPLALSAGVVLLNGSYWLLWILLSVFITIARLVYSIFIVLHIIADLLLITLLKTGYTFYHMTVGRAVERQSTKRVQLEEATTYEEYMALAHEVDKEEGMLEWRENDADFPQAEVLRRITATLDEALKAHDVHKLKFTLLSGLLKRNHLGIDERELHMKALSGTKKCIEDYMSKMVEVLRFLCECSELSADEKVAFFKKARRSLGCTALMLSGGGAIAMYHAGVVRTLIEEGLYKYIRVVSGTSGGSIVAGMLAFQTEKTLLYKCLVDEVSTDYGYDGRMKRENIRWFPPIIDQIKHFLRNGVLIDHREFQRTCEFYYGDITFQEAFERTHKHISITVSASQLGSTWQGGPQRLLLNHITTPDVLISSAVAASCALPGIMIPTGLQCKDSDGSIVQFELDGVQYVDGSLQADLPFERLAAIFLVSNSVVSQVNFHVVPFLPSANSPSESSWYWRVFRLLDADIRHRAVSLGDLGLLPKFFGQDLSGVFRQRYHGDVTIVPKLRLSEMIGLQACCNPSIDEMTHYLLDGKRMTWPTINHIRHTLTMERALSDCLNRLRRSSYLSFKAKALEQSGISLILNPSLDIKDRQLPSEMKGLKIKARPLTPESVRSGEVLHFDDDEDMVLPVQPLVRQGTMAAERGSGVGSEASTGGGGGGWPTVTEREASLQAEVSTLRDENEKLKALLNEVLHSSVISREDAEQPGMLPRFGSLGDSILDDTDVLGSRQPSLFQ